MTKHGIKTFAKWDIIGCITLGLLDAMSKGLLVKGAGFVVGYGFGEGVVLAVYIALPALCIVGAITVYRTIRTRPTVEGA